MNKIVFRNFLKLVIGLFGICGVLLYQNCASQGSGASPFSIALGSTSPGALTISPISLASSTIQIATSYSAAVTLTGADLSGLSCIWSLSTSAGTAIGSNVVTQANSNSVCVASLTAPATAGSYNLSVSATNMGGEVVTSSAVFSTQSGVVPPNYQLTISSSSPAAYPGETLTFTGTAITNVTGAYSLTIGKIVNGVQTPISGCSISSTGTSITFTCLITFTTLGAQNFYINLSQGGTTMLACAAPSASCLGSAYSVTVIAATPPPQRCNPITQVNGQRILMPICNP